MIHSEALRQMLAPHDEDGRHWGVVVGIVSDNRDPDGMHRVKLRFPWLADDHESHWARVASAMAGPDRGLYALPEVDDEVLVAFEHGSLDHAYVIGSLWNGKDKPPESNADGKNDHRTLKSRSGHIVRLSDASGDERIEVIDKSGRNRITISTSDNKISIEAEGDIAIRSQTGKVAIEGLSIEIKAQTGIKVEAETNLDLSASGPTKIAGAVVNIN